MSAGEMSDIKEIRATVERLERRLFGNGQPGEIDKLHARISATNGKVEAIARWKYQVTAVLAVLLLILQSLGGLGGVVEKLK